MLTRGETIIACEISATTTTAGHELENILKCLRAGYQTIAHVCDNETRRQRLRDLLNSETSAPERERVQFFTTARFLTHLQTIGTESAPAAAPAQGDKSPVSLSKSMTEVEMETDAQRMLDEIKARRSQRRGGTGV